MAHLVKKGSRLNHPPPGKTELEDVGSQGEKVKQHKEREKQKVMPSAKGKKKTKP